MSPWVWIFAGAMLGALAVASGAFGAHLLQQWWEGALKVNRLAIWETAAKYQMYHALALVLVGFLAMSNNGQALQVAGWAFLSGTIVFSGMLYLLASTQIAFFGAIVPIGGASLIVGWVAFAVYAWQKITW